jgi:hypothetical protein
VANIKQAFDELKAVDPPASENQSESNGKTEKKEPHQESGKDAH